MPPEHRDLLRRLRQAEESVRRQGGSTQSFRLQHTGGMGREIAHPGWDPSWAIPTEHTIDDLAELGLLRVEPPVSKQRDFVLSVKGRHEAERLLSAVSGAPPAGHAKADEVLAWLVEVARDHPGAFGSPGQLLHLAQADGLVGDAGRRQLAACILDLVRDGYLHGDVPTWDQDSPEEQLQQTRDLRISLQAHRILPSYRSTGTSSARDRTDVVYDVFISHASPDKEVVARPLAAILQARGFSVWFDESELVVGDRLSSGIDLGLSSARSGVVILSESFFGRPWTERELAGLVARETATGKPLILPVWHDLTREDIVRVSPPLADVLAVTTENGLEAVADALAPAIERRRRQDQLSGRPRSAADLATTAARQTAVDTLEDEELLAFDASRLLAFDLEEAHQLLVQHGDLYRAQLVIALWLDGWRERMDREAWDDSSPSEAYDYAVREIAAHLRQGDFLPGGVFFQDVAASSDDDPSSEA